MMPISALPALPTPLPAAPAAPVLLDFTALMQGDPIAPPTPELTAGEPAPAPVAAPGLSEAPGLDAHPLPAPPPILAMLHAPVRPAPVRSPSEEIPADVVAMIDPAPLESEQTEHADVEAQPFEGLPAPAPSPAAPAIILPSAVSEAHVVPTATTADPAPVTAPLVRQNVAPLPVSGASPNPAPREAVVAVIPSAPPVAVVMPSESLIATTTFESVVPAAVALPVQPDVPRPARGTPVLPPLPASAPTAAPAPPAFPTMREAPSSPPPAEVQALVADAITSEPPAAPDQPAAPLAQSVAAAPAQRTAQPDALQPQIDTTDPRWIDRMAQEIADLANGDGRARFRLNPETLGSMEITVRHTADGISVRFEVDNESTRALLAHTEQRLQAEARANGLRIADTQVDLAQQQNQRGGRERPAEQPLIAVRTTSSETTTTAERAPASARYA
jgi:hypothetical protein